MSKKKRGFTLIEISLFMVLTAALFVGVAAGTHNSIYQQRYNDSVQNFMEFLRSAYSRTSNVENQGSGRSNSAIYGKLITFGESYDLAGNRNDDKNAIFVYDVLGDVGDIGTGTALSSLISLNANVVLYNEDEGFYATGLVDSYTLKWNADLEPPCSATSCSYDDFKGSILIVRHPRSGTVYTYFYDDTIEVNELTSERNRVINGAKGTIVSAEESKRTAEADIETGQNNLTTAQAERQAAQDDRAAAQARYNEASSRYASATTDEEREAAQAEMQAAQNDKTAAQTALVEANSAVTAAQAEINNANNRINTANSQIRSANETIENTLRADNNPLLGYLSEFAPQEINFCINPNSGEETRLRQNVKIELGARNASGVILVAMDSDENNCTKR